MPNRLLRGRYMPFFSIVDIGDKYALMTASQWLKPKSHC